ncbi:MAG: hypothetical protein V1748_13035 [Actinomycetota bacterium]
MYESDRLGNVGLPPGEYSTEIAQLSEQIERIAVQIDDIWAVLIMIKATLENYGPKDMVGAWSRMLEDWREKRKDQEREAARQAEESGP